MKKLVFCCSILSFDSSVLRRLSISNSSLSPVEVHAVDAIDHEEQGASGVGDQPAERLPHLIQE